jgi:hypothetical protein
VHTPSSNLCERGITTHLTNSDVPVIILRVGRSDGCLQQPRQLELADQSGGLRQIRANQIHEVLYEVPLPQQQVLLDGQAVLPEAVPAKDGRQEPGRDAGVRRLDELAEGA